MVIRSMTMQRLGWLFTKKSMAAPLVRSCLIPRARSLRPRPKRSLPLQKVSRKSDCVLAESQYEGNRRFDWSLS